ncbi:tetratricopeptide repeat protein [Ancylobacter sp. Lp-2]|uniref:tetratricopeptide repeat protein n=1 Tax=Ancylobacter sp. Lp-2 TaxID=2881339 RepID=UPI001E3EFF47|nr:tetratricopeptide repeat protein [Ancylobacter sp. Lp-2]MCB4771522.1 tetratricopeptide repeat protein [Ancylobacter sp. Lp-2]
MGFLKTGLEKVAAVCVGAAALAFGTPPAGAMEVGIGTAALIGFVLDRREKFGPECRRVRERLQRDLLASYGELIAGSDGDATVRTELRAADAALDEALEHCVIDRAALAAAAVSREGFADRAAIVIMARLGEAHPELFGPERRDTLSYRFAGDVVRAGIATAAEDADYYRRLEPLLMLEFGRALGAVREDVAETRRTVEQIRDDYRRELALAKDKLHATEADLVSLLTFILQRRVSRETVPDALEQSYTRLTELRESFGDLGSLANETPEIAPLLERANAALTAGESFSLDDADRALAEVDRRYQDVIAAREETLKRHKANRAQILGKRAELATIKYAHAEAVSLLRERAALLAESIGPDHPETLAGIAQLALGLDAQGRHGEAEPLHRQVTDAVEQLLGSEHEATLEYRSDLALNLDARGLHAEAESLHRSSLEIRRRTLGDMHPHTGWSCNNLALNLHAQGRYREAEPLHRQAFDIARSAPDAEYSSSMASSNNLATNLKAQARYAEAEQLYCQALTLCEANLGEEHPDTATIYDNLATNKVHQGLYVEAESLFAKALDIRQRFLGDDHPYTAQSFNNVGHNLYSQGRHEEAERFQRKALNIRQRILGEDHPSTAASYDNLASLLDSLHRYAEAEPLHRQALAIQRHRLGPDHPDTAISVGSLGTNLVHQRHLGEAEALLRDALGLYEQAFGPDHPDTAFPCINLAYCLTVQGRHSEAEPLYRRALDIRDRRLGTNHPDTAKSRAYVAANLRAQGKGS